MSRSNIVITMAGRGRRFVEAGYGIPKYEIEVRGRCLFDWALSSLANFLTKGCRVIFVCLKENCSGAFLHDRLREMHLSDIRICELAEVTDGQATSAYQSRDLWFLDGPLLIYNIDTRIAPASLKPSFIRPRSDGWMPCARMAGDHWSFVALGEDGWAVEVAEKKRISEYASLGLYWFARAGEYVSAYEHMQEEGDEWSRGERYVAPLYKHFIRSGKKISISELPASRVDVLGTPDELEAFKHGTVDAADVQAI